MKKYFAICNVIILLLCLQNVLMCMDDEHTQSVIWFGDKDTKISSFIKIPFITRLAKEEVEFYRSQGTPINFAIETLSPFWKTEERFEQYGHLAVPSYEACLEVKYAQLQDLSYKEYLRQRTEYCDEMIISMAKSLYFIARHSDPPYPLNSAVNLGFALYKFGDTSTRKLCEFIRCVGWLPQRSDLPNIGTIWKNMCFIESMVSSSELRNKKQEYISYIATLLGLSDEEVAVYFSAN